MGCIVYGTVRLCRGPPGSQGACDHTGGSGGSDGGGASSAVSTGASGSSGVVDGMPRPPGPRRRPSRSTAAAATTTMSSPIPTHSQRSELRPPDAGAGGVGGVRMEAAET